MQGTMEESEGSSLPGTAPRFSMESLGIQLHELQSSAAAESTPAALATQDILAEQQPQRDGGKSSARRAPGSNPYTVCRDPEEERREKGRKRSAEESSVRPYDAILSEIPEHPWFSEAAVQSPPPRLQTHLSFWRRPNRAWSYIPLADTVGESPQQQVRREQWQEPQQETVSGVLSATEVDSFDWHLTDAVHAACHPREMQFRPKFQRPSLADPPVQKSLSRDWNEEFQTIYETRIQSFQDLVNRTRRLNQLSDEFVQFSRHVVRIIIEELPLPPEERTLQRAAGMNGLAGGTKFVVGKVFFKFATNNHDIYDSLADAQKSAGNELRAINAVSQQNMNKLHITLTAVFHTRGHCIMAIAECPIQSQETLVSGSADAGKTLVDKDPKLRQLMQQLAQKMHIAEHPVMSSNPGERVCVSLYSAGDVECHFIPKPKSESRSEGSDGRADRRDHPQNLRLPKRTGGGDDPGGEEEGEEGDEEEEEEEEEGPPGRFYLIDLARHLPPTPPKLNTSQHLTHQFRPEFLQHLRRLHQHLLLKHRRRNPHPHQQQQQPTSSAAEDEFGFPPLSSDSYSQWGRMEHRIHNARVRKAFRYLLQTHIPLFGRTLHTTMRALLHRSILREIDSEKGSPGKGIPTSIEIGRAPPDGGRPVLEVLREDFPKLHLQIQGLHGSLLGEFDWIGEMHSQGINIRYLGHLYRRVCKMARPDTQEKLTDDPNDASCGETAATRSDWLRRTLLRPKFLQFQALRLCRLAILLEMVARCLKVRFRRHCALLSREFVSEEPYLLAGTHLLAGILCFPGGTDCDPSDQGGVPEDFPPPPQSDLQLVSQTSQPVPIPSPSSGQPASSSVSSAFDPPDFDRGLQPSVQQSRMDVEGMEEESAENAVLASCGWYWEILMEDLKSKFLEDHTYILREDLEALRAALTFTPSEQDGEDGGTQLTDFLCSPTLQLLITRMGLRFEEIPETIRDDEDRTLSALPPTHLPQHIQPLWRVFRFHPKLRLQLRMKEKRVYNPDFLDINRADKGLSRELRRKWEDGLNEEDSELLTRTLDQLYDEPDNQAFPLIEAALCRIGGMETFHPQIGLSILTTLTNSVSIQFVQRFLYENDETYLRAADVQKIVSTRLALHHMGAALLRRYPMLQRMINDAVALFKSHPKYRTKKAVHNFGEFWVLLQLSEDWDWKDLKQELVTEVLTRGCLWMLKDKQHRAMEIGVYPPVDSPLHSSTKNGNHGSRSNRHRIGQVDPEEEEEEEDLEVSLCYRLTKSFESQRASWCLLLFMVAISDSVKPSLQSPVAHPDQNTTAPRAAGSEDEAGIEEEEDDDDDPSLAGLSSLITPASSFYDATRSLRRPSPEQLRRATEALERIRRVWDWGSCFDFLQLPRPTPREHCERLREALRRSLRLEYHTGTSRKNFRRRKLLEQLRRGEFGCVCTKRRQRISSSASSSSSTSSSSSGHGYLSSTLRGLRRGRASRRPVGGRKAASIQPRTVSPTSSPEQQGQREQQYRLQHQDQEDKPETIPSGKAVTRKKNAPLRKSEQLPAECVYVELDGPLPDIRHLVPPETPLRQRHRSSRRRRSAQHHYSPRQTQHHHHDHHRQRHQQQQRRRQTWTRNSSQASSPSNPSRWNRSPNNRSQLHQPSRHDNQQQANKHHHKQ